MSRLWNKGRHSRMFLSGIQCLFCALFLISCSAALKLPVEVPSRSGEVFQKKELERTGSRKDVPADKKPRDVVSQSSLTHAGGNVGRIVITQGFWPWSAVFVYTNCANCHADASKLLTVEQPKRPWYFWPAWVLSGLAAIAVVIFGSYLRGLLSPLIGFLKRR